MNFGMRTAWVVNVKRFPTNVFRPVLSIAPGLKFAMYSRENFSPVGGPKFQPGPNSFREAKTIREPRTSTGSEIECSFCWLGCASHQKLCKTLVLVSCCSAIRELRTSWCVNFPLPSVFFFWGGGGRPRYKTTVFRESETLGSST